MQMFADLQAQIGDQLRVGAETAQSYAERIIGRLDVIAEGVLSLQSRNSERVTVTAFIEAGTTEKVLDARAGYMVTIEHVSIVTQGATDVDIHVGSQGEEGFRTRLSTAAAGRASGALSEYHAPENSPIFATAGANGARVNIQVKREQTY